MRESARKHSISFSERERERSKGRERGRAREREYAQCSGQTGSGWDEVGGGTVGEELLLLLLLLLVIVVNCSCVCVCLCGMRAAKSLTWSPSLSTPAARRFVLKKVTTNFETQPEHRLRPSTSTSPSLFADNREFIVVSLLFLTKVLCVCVYVCVSGLVTSLAVAIFKNLF